jgi:hypothetical protein
LEGNSDEECRVETKRQNRFVLRVLPGWILRREAGLAFFGGRNRKVMLEGKRIMHRNMCIVHSFLCIIE